MPDDRPASVPGPRVGAVILAAGAGMRLGGVAKALLAGRDERSFLQCILDTARGVGLAHAVVVVGPPHDQLVAAHARELGAEVVVNPEPERGMASSIALGFAAIAATTCDAAWLWPVDHPDVREHTLRTLLAALGTHQVARPRYEERGGHPPLIRRALFGALAQCTFLDGGAREVIAVSDTIDIATDDDGVVRDVDTAVDLERL